MPGATSLEKAERAMKAEGQGDTGGHKKAATDKKPHGRVGVSCVLP
jgi:hypothetical protein